MATLAVQAEMSDDSMEAVPVTNHHLLLLPATPGTTTYPATTADMVAVDADASTSNTGDAANTVTANFTIITKDTEDTSNIAPNNHAGFAAADINTISTNAAASADGSANVTNVDTIAVNADQDTARQVDDNITLKVTVQDITCPICKDVFTSAYM
jgi:hypothetical protein